MIEALRKKVLDGVLISPDDALLLSAASGDQLFDLMASANRLRAFFRGDHIDLCAIINAKSGACSEDCAYCAQSARNPTGTEVFPLKGKKTILGKAKEAKEGGAKRFCIVTGGRRPSKNELENIADAVSDVRSLGLLPCATLGLLDIEDIVLLKEAGLKRYHHNLETSERLFPSICSTHTYQDKIRTISSVQSAGLSLCSGGIFGLGETWDDRIDMAFALRKINPDSVPLNFLIPVSGTPLGHRKYIEPLEALKIVSIYRFILPDREIRICGGRMQTLGEFNSFVFFAGADGLLTGNYLTTTGRDYKDDIDLIRHYGLHS